MNEAIEQAALIIRQSADTKNNSQRLIDESNRQAHALADAGLLATRTEYSAACLNQWGEVCPIGTEGSYEHAAETRDDCAKDDTSVRFFIARRSYTEWHVQEEP